MRNDNGLRVYHTHRRPILEVYIYAPVARHHLIEPRKVHRNLKDTNRKNTGKILVKKTSVQRSRNRGFDRREGRSEQANRQVVWQ